MKSRSLIIVVMVSVAGMVLMNSCNKKYICHCDIKYSGVPGLPDTTSQEYNITDSKDGANSKCKAESGTFDNNGVHTVENCYLY